MKIVKQGPYTFKTLHMTYSQPAAGLYTLTNETTGAPLDNYNDTTKGIQQLIADAVQNNTSLRAQGGNWSFSPITATAGVVLNTQGLNSIFPINANSTNAAYTGDKSKLVLAQCGNGIWELSKFLNARGMSLSACGASNGQTIAGAIATGTHGAGVSFGAIQEGVVGLHIITSPTSSIWLERATVPVMADDFAGKLGATLVRDDAKFYAALVSFGAFGFVHGVMIQAEANYLLECYLRRVPYDDAYKQAFSTVDFNYSHLPYPGEVPFHFQTLINPYDLDNGAYMTVMYKRPFGPHTPPGPNGAGVGPGDDAPTFIGKIADCLPGVLPVVANGVLKSSLELYEKKMGTLAEIFCNTTLSGKVTSTALGFEPKHIATVIDALMQLNKTSGPFAGVFAFRFVKASKATMAFTRFAPITCVLELDGVQCEATSNFYAAVWQKLTDLGIPYTLHWGKMNNLDAGKVQNMYGASLDSFKAARTGTVDAATLKVFSNHALQTYGIDAFGSPPPTTLIV